MVRGLNRIYLIGNLGREPELRYTPSGVAVANASLGVNGRKKGPDGEWGDHTEWFNLVFIDRQAETFTEYAHKGSPIHVEGRGQFRQYTDRENVERKVFEVVVNQFILLGNQNNDAGGGNPVPARPARKSPDPNDAAYGDGEDWGFDDVPF